MPSSLQWETVEALAAAGAMFLSIIICTGIFRCRTLPERRRSTEFMEVPGLYTSGFVYQSRPPPITVHQHHEIHLEEKPDVIYENFGNGLEINQHMGPGLIREAGESYESELEGPSMYLNEADNIYCNYGFAYKENCRCDEDYIFPDEQLRNLPSPVEEPSEFHCE